MRAEVLSFAFANPKKTGVGKMRQEKGENWKEKTEKNALQANKSCCAVWGLNDRSRVSPTVTDRDIHTARRRTHLKPRQGCHGEGEE
jgi:hypothetical protein